MAEISRRMCGLALHIPHGSSAPLLGAQASPLHFQEEVLTSGPARGSQQLPWGSAGRTLIDLVLHQPLLHSRTEEKRGKATSGLCDLGHGANLSEPHVQIGVCICVCVCVCVCVLVSESCLTLCNPTDCSPPASSVHGISQARILEWVATSSSRGSS